jgi:hypothetical protein
MNSEIRKRLISEIMVIIGKLSDKNIERLYVFACGLLKNKANT